MHASWKRMTSFKRNACSPPPLLKWRIDSLNRDSKPVLWLSILFSEIIFVFSHHYLIPYPQSYPCHHLQKGKGYINPILTGGGGGFDPRLYEIRDCLATATDRDTPFHEFFRSSLTYLLIPSLRKSDHRSRSHVTFCTRTSAQNFPKLRILHMFVYKTHGNYWFS